MIVVPKKRSSADRVRDERLLPFRSSGDALWVLVEEGFRPARIHEIESLFAVSNGYLGTRASLAEGSTPTRPATLLAGVFAIQAEPGAIPELVSAPDWTHLLVHTDQNPFTLESDGTMEHRRGVDFQQAAYWRQWRYRDAAGRITRMEMVRLASLEDRHLVFQSVALSPENFSGPIRLESSFPDTPGLTIEPPEAVSPHVLHFRAPGTDIRVAVAAASRLHGVEAAGSDTTTSARQEPSAQRWTIAAEPGKVYRLDRFVCIYSTRETPDPSEAAAAHLRRVLAESSAETVLEAHRRAWSVRWQDADVRVEGDSQAQTSLRFATYHLIAAANPDDTRVSVGARALTGSSYKGHVFWDTEIFMLPFYIYTCPEAARALLMYRWHTLGGAREKAKANGYHGAMYAWESAADGHETTPSTALTPDGKLIHILCGQQEQHITADVAYAVWSYWQASGDDDFFRDAGAEILLDTARFWASRVNRGPDDRYHIQRVIGPDEYHEGIDDSAFTNVMAAWNLRRGVETLRLLDQRWPREAGQFVERLGIAPGDVQQWQEIADRMYTGFDPRTGLFEQFKGYFSLEDIDLAQYEPRSAPIDVLLGRERTQQSQLVKQADVVMLIALLWNDFEPRVREINFRYYEPRTGHGSSLSPAIHALVAARLGDITTAERYFRQAAEIDLANNMGNASGGVHAAALGGLWQAAVLGFAGMTAHADRLDFDPRLPLAWRRLRFPVAWRGRRLEVSVGKRPVSLEVMLVSGDPMVVTVSNGSAVEVQPGGRYRVRRDKAGWGEWEGESGRGRVGGGEWERGG